MNKPWTLDELEQALSDITPVSDRYKPAFLVDASNLGPEFWESTEVPRQADGAYLFRNRVLFVGQFSLYANSSPVVCDIRTAHKLAENLLRERFYDQTHRADALKMALEHASVPLEDVPQLADKFYAYIKG